MTRKTTPTALDTIATATGDVPEIVQHPDGYYWTNGRNQEVGPFETYALAQADRDAVGDDVGSGAVLREVEQEIGLPDWIDAQTGAPADFESSPHLPEE